MKIKNPLFLGVGGGNDAYSCALAALCLRRQGITWEKAIFSGVLSPFHTHSGSPVLPGVLGIRRDSRRWHVNNAGCFEIPFVDAGVLAAVCGSDALMEDLGVDSLIGITLKKGSVGVSESIRRLAEAQGVDHVFLVDVGGDILYRSSEDGRILSPMFDSLSLRGVTDSGVPASLFEAGPGTDGELDAAPLREMLTAPGVSSLKIDPADIDLWEKGFAQYVRPIRAGSTVPQTIRAFRLGGGVTTIPHSARSVIGSRRWKDEFTHCVDADLCQKFFMLDPGRIGNPLAISCRSPLEWLSLTRRAGRLINNEGYLQSLETSCGRVVIFSPPESFFSADEKRDMFVEALRAVDRGQFDWVAVFTDELGKIQELGLIEGRPLDREGVEGCVLVGPS